jgi:hypothetical protein
MCLKHDFDLFSFVADLKKKDTKPKRPSVKSLFGRPIPVPNLFLGNMHYDHPLSSHLKFLTVI